MWMTKVPCVVEIRDIDIVATPMVFMKLSRYFRINSLLSRSLSLKIPCPEFRSEDVSRTGKYLPWRIFSLLAETRRNHFDLHGEDPEFLSWKELTKNLLTFYASLQTTFSRDFYRNISDSFFKRRIPTGSMYIDLRLGYVGNTSASFISSLIQSKNSILASTEDEKIDRGIVLASSTIQMVFVDRQTRQPKPPPTWWLEKYQPKSDPQHKLIVSQFEVPFSSQIFVHHIPITWNHMDLYQHTHYKCYVEFCFEVANEGVKSSFFPDGFRCFGDVLNREVRLIEMVHLGESLPGDVLRATMWVDPLDDHMLRFSFERVQRGISHLGIICQGSIGFHA